jgi:hypothetical protein
MNTDTMNVGISSINKFISYSLNYPTLPYKVMSDDSKEVNRYLPDFFTAFYGESIFNHLADKWVESSRGTDGYGRLTKFYTELGSGNRKKMLAYIMENYDYEQKII